MRTTLERLMEEYRTEEARMSLETHRHSLERDDFERKYLVPLDLKIARERARLGRESIENAIQRRAYRPQDYR